MKSVVSTLKRLWSGSVRRQLVLGIAAVHAVLMSIFIVDLVSMWLLFPEDRPYQTYNLVQYPADRGDPPEVLDSRYKIHHPYGSLIGWSVVNPEIGNVYECRWTYE